MKKLIAFFAVVLLVAFVAGCSEDEDCPTCPANTDPTPNLSYVGSDGCAAAACHPSIYNTFIESGHPFKLSEVVGSTGPTYPWDSNHPNATVSGDGPPGATPWSDYAYVIGGYGWKARWVETDGDVHIGTGVQLNLWGDNPPEWVDYHVGNPTSYQYSCFKCHTTGASDQGSWAAGSSGLGTFAFGGVQCEECHGQASQHVTDPPRYEMLVDRTSALCGRCHTRDPQNRVLVSGGYIRHHEQYDEMVHSPHAAVGCNACHDPHASVVYDADAMGSGVKATCESCHPGYDYTPGGANQNQHFSGGGRPECTDCHMPKAAKSARVTSNPYVADVASHTFQIDTSAVDKSTMWTSDGAFLNQDEFGRGHLTLDFACYSCHKDAAGAGGAFSQRTLQQLADRANGIHTPPPPPFTAQATK